MLSNLKKFNLTHIMRLRALFVWLLLTYITIFTAEFAVPVSKLQESSVRQEGSVSIQQVVAMVEQERDKAQARLLQIKEEPEKFTREERVAHSKKSLEELQEIFKLALKQKQDEKAVLDKKAAQLKKELEDLAHHHEETERRLEKIRKEGAAKIEALEKEGAAEIAALHEELRKYRFDNRWVVWRAGLLVAGILIVGCIWWFKKPYAVNHL